MDEYLDQQGKLKMELCKLDLSGDRTSVIEVGCSSDGFTQELMDTLVIDEYIGINESLIELHKVIDKIVKKAGMSQFFQIPFDKLNLKKKKSIIFSSGVLSKTDENEVSIVMRRMILASSKYVIHIDDDNSHDYEKLWIQLGEEVEVIPTMGRKAIYVVRL